MSLLSRRALARRRRRPRAGFKPVSFMAQRSNVVPSAVITGSFMSSHVIGQHRSSGSSSLDIRNLSISARWWRSSSSSTLWCVATSWRIASADASIFFALPADGPRIARQAPARRRGPRGPWA